MVKGGDEEEGEVDVADEELDGEDLGTEKSGRVRVTVVRSRDRETGGKADLTDLANVNLNAGAAVIRREHLMVLFILSYKIKL